jgi:hypothetical protein
MGSWGFYDYPSEPRQPSDAEIEEFLAEWEEKEAELEWHTELREQLDNEVSTDEGGWGAWMGGEL